MDLENRSRRNNLRILGIPEGLEGGDVLRFIIEMFSEAFPELQHWKWEIELQRVHRFPFQLRTGRGGSNEKPRAILICLNNFLLREAIYDLARPDKKRCGKGCEFFFRLDFCQATVQKRWHLHQLIPLFQAKGAQVFLLYPEK